MLVHRLPLPSSPVPPKSFGNAEEAKIHRTRVVLCCSSIRPNSQDVGDKGTGIRRVQCQEPHVVVLERYANGTTKRYLLEDGLDCAYIEKLESNKFLGMDFPDKEYSWIPDFVKHFVLPAGFPGSVSDDYLEYMLLQFPTNVTAWICHALVTSSLLKAAGLGSVSGTTAAASAAAIRWVSKDGIGAVGRLLIGGRFGNLFDDDPKQWRMYADFIGSAGSIFDLSTQLFPAYFLPLASLGNLAKAVARGLKDPSFRVIQNHFAIAGNVGEVAAKEEVWEVAAQLLGLALGILILINLKRARILVKSHILHSTIPGCVDCNRRENILSWQRYIKPRIVYGVPLEEMIGGEKSLTAVKMLLKLYANEKYILVVHQQKGDFEVLVSFKVGATSLSVLRSVWQTYWLHESCNKREEKTVYQLERSLLALEDRFEDFMQQLGAAGWDVSQIILKVPDQISVEVLRSI